MKKLFLLFAFLIIQPFLCQKATDSSPKNETQSLTEAIAYISKYYEMFTTEYDYKGEYKMLSSLYKPTFSGSNFTLTFNSYGDKNKITVHTEKIDFKKVLSMQPYGGEMVQVCGSETEKIPVALKIGFKTKTEMKTVNIYVEDEDEDDITVTPIYKAFETVWKFYKK